MSAKSRATQHRQWAVNAIVDAMQSTNSVDRETLLHDRPEASCAGSEGRTPPHPAPATQSGARVKSPRFIDTSEAAPAGAASTNPGPDRTLALEGRSRVRSVSLGISRGPIPHNPPPRHASRRPTPRPPSRSARSCGRSAAPAPATGRTFGYFRVSSDAQAEDGQSLDVQQRQLEGWAMQRGQQLDAVDRRAGRQRRHPVPRTPRGRQALGVAAEGRHPGGGEAGPHVPHRVGLPGRGGGVQGARRVPVPARPQRRRRRRVRQRDRPAVPDHRLAPSPSSSATGSASGSGRPSGRRRRAASTSAGRRRSASPTTRSRKLVPVPEQQRALRRIRKLQAEGLSPYKISAASLAWGEALPRHGAEDHHRPREGDE